MTEQEFLERWRLERPMYRAWGQYVTDRVIKSLEQAGCDIGTFLCLPSKPRLKPEKSLIDKAFFRKNYANPYEDVTDKVGTRFVVLLASEVQSVVEAVEACEEWECSKDRDFLTEREERPFVFGYQSVHFVVRAKDALSTGGCDIAPGTPCEVQIRTLLQHAYSELTHDTIYKPKSFYSSLAERYCARSMALIETTDEFFEKVVEAIQAIEKPLVEALEYLTEAYARLVGLSPERGRVNYLILDALAGERERDKIRDLETFIQQKPFVVDRIKERAGRCHLFRQPVVLLLYHFVYEHPNRAKDKWPLTPEELRPIFNDLGISFDGPR